MLFQLQRSLPFAASTFDTSKNQKIDPEKELKYLENI